VAHDGANMSERRGPRLSESNRVEAFSDGVFAIAITLLVLELAIPATSGEFTKELRDEWVSYVAYLAAFANIGVLWMGHHTAFTRIRAVDARLSRVPTASARPRTRPRPSSRTRSSGWRPASPGSCSSTTCAAIQT
jgi:hypothetical protein